MAVQNASDMVRGRSAILNCFQIQTHRRPCPAIQNACEAYARVLERDKSRPAGRRSRKNTTGILNNAGDVVGFSNAGAWIWDSANGTLLLTPPSSPRADTCLGHVRGRNVPVGGTHAPNHWGGSGTGDSASEWGGSGRGDPVATTVDLVHTTQSRSRASTAWSRPSQRAGPCWRR
jgi:hypothetical protein